MTDIHRKRRRYALIIMAIGLLLVMGAAFLTLRNLREGKQAETASEGALTKLSSFIPEKKLARSTVAEYIAHAETNMPMVDIADDVILQRQVNIPLYILDPKIPMPKTEIDGRFYIGTLEVPILGLELPVLDDCTFSGLKIAPNRWSGSVYEDNLVICAHNYQRHFGTLKNLQTDDLVTFTDMDGNLFVYRVAVVEVLEPESVEEMEESEYDLTLFTCTIGGATRVTVRCVRERET